MLIIADEDEFWYEPNWEVHEDFVLENLDEVKLWDNRLFFYMITHLVTDHLHRMVLERVESKV